MALIKMPQITQQRLRLHRLLMNSSEDFLRECAKEDRQSLKTELRKGVAVEEGPLCVDIHNGDVRIWQRDGTTKGVA